MTTTGRGLRPFAAAFAGYAILTIVMLRSVVAHLTTRLPHDLGDPLLSMTLLWWNAHVTPLTERWWNGFAFWPASGMMAFSDHRLGQSLIASPLQWIGISTLTAYNVTLLLMFPLCAMAAHAAAFALTKRHDASIVAGLAYGFNPYRFAHLEHLELLGAFGMPAALAALHMYVEERRARWLVVFAAALLLQGLFSSYYVVFFAVLLALWILWFVRRSDIGVLVGLGVALAIVAALLAPIAYSFLVIHRQHAFVRNYNAIIELSADVVSYLAASPLNVVWGWTSRYGGGERELFPGLTIVLLVAAGGIVALRSAPATGVSNRLALVMASIGVVAALVAAVAALSGGGRITVGGIQLLSVGTPFKPLSLAFLAFSIALLASSPLRGAYSRRSAFAFYVLAAAFLVLCSFGPKARVLGHQFLYEPPYAWLMEIRMFGEGIRVPARFAMPAILALSMAAAIAFDRLTRASPLRRGLIIVAAVAIVADSWIVSVPTFELPSTWESPPAARDVKAFVELPLGDVEQDIAAMYRSTVIGLPTVNGNSGYIPQYYQAAHIGLDERDDSVLDAVAVRGPILVAVRRHEDHAEERLAWLRAHPGAVALGEDRDAWFFRVTGSAPPAVHCGNALLPIATASDRHGAIDLHPLTDNDMNTYWTTAQPQQPGDWIQFDLGAPAAACSIRPSLGTLAAFYPRRLIVETSVDANSWQKEFTGAMGGAAVLSAFERPDDVRLEIPLGAAAIRYIRLRLDDGFESKAAWIVSDVTVVARGPSGRASQSQ